MKSSAKKIELASVDDLFSTEEGRQDAKLEKIQEIPLSELHPFRNHPFKVKDDEAMMETADSIKQYGVLVRRLPDQTRRAVMNWWPDTGGTEPVNWQKRRPCRSLFGIWMMMPLRSLWLTATCSEKACSPVKEHLLIK